MSVEHYDFIIVGSGFGGAVAAHKLVQSGARVLLLERGPGVIPNRCAGKAFAMANRLPAGRHLLASGAYPECSLLPRRGVTLNRHGLYDIHYARDMTLICASGVGGGSHAYSAMNTRPEVDNYWQKILGKTAAARMEQHYDWMLQVMGAQAPTADERIPNFTGDQFRDSPHFVADASVPQPAMGIRRDPLLNPFQNSSFWQSYRRKNHPGRGADCTGHGAGAHGAGRTRMSGCASPPAAQRLPARCVRSWQ
ncbi:MAG: NAD(P)-binding protein [Gammaproteobacteria bacterium]